MTGRGRSDSPVLTPGLTHEGLRLRFYEKIDVRLDRIRALTRVKVTQGGALQPRTA